MSFQNFKSSFYSVGGFHQIATISIEPDITEMGQNFFFGKCVRCNRNKINEC